MHKVDRNNPPKGLEIKDKEFQNEIDNNSDIDIKWNSFTKTKLKKETLEALEEMYAGCCAYCEGDIGGTDYAEIEHFKPKSKFPELAYKYDNLHYSCTKCNKNKGDQYSELMIEPCIDEPELHIKYEGNYAIAKDEKGSYTIQVVKLNDRVRLKKRYNRLKEIQERVDLVIEILERKDELNIENIGIINTLISKTVEEISQFTKHGQAHCTMIKHNFSEDIKYLRNINIKLSSNIKNT